MKKNFKKLLAAVLAVVMVLTLAACSSGSSGAGEKTVEGTVDKNVSSGGQLAASDKGVTSISDDSSNASGSGSQESTVKLNGYYFVSNGVNVCIDDVAADTADKLGVPEYEPFEAASCAFDGMTITYTYKGFVFDTYDNNGTNCIYSIVLMNDQVATAEGVKIGDSASKITEKYGEPTEKTETSMTYVKDNMQLLFILRDGVIDQIQYLSL